MLKLGRKKPKQERSKNTVDTIIKAVTHIIENEGNKALNTNRIAEKAGVSIGSLYQYFKNKESIFEAILLQLTEKNMASIEKQLTLMPENTEIRELVHLLISAHFENVEQMGKLSKIIFEYAPHLLSPEHFQKSDKRIIGFLLTKISEFNIKIRPTNKEDAFFICTHAVRSVIYMSVMLKDRRKWKTICDELSEMITLYLLPPQ